MNLEDQIARIMENAERAHELTETASTVEQNATDFIAWCDAMGIQSQSDNSKRA